MKRKATKPKFRFKNPSQISISENLFHRTTSRLNTYKNVELLLERLKRSLKNRYGHVNFEHPTKIYKIEEALLEILELLDG